MTSKQLKQLYWTDAHFCGLRAQTNIYGLTKITSKEGLTNLLAASINGHFVSIEYQKSSNRLTPITREDLLFSSGSNSGPGGDAEIFEIVSVDVICSSDKNGPNVLAVTYFMLPSHFEEKSPSPHMNLYFVPQRDPEGPYLNIIDVIPLSHVQNFNLDFIPFKLMHWPVYTEDGSLEMCFLLGGGDNKVHVYRKSTEFEYEEVKDLKRMFPEFATAGKSCVNQIELMQVNKDERLTAVGLQCGEVTLSLVNIKSNVLINTWSVEMDSPITSMKIFTLSTQVPIPDFLEQRFEDWSPLTDDKDPEAIHLLITPALESAVVFWDVLKCGLSKSHLLPYSNSQDVVLCSCVTDIDFDGENEILIGTYGQVLLAYKFVEEEPQSTVVTSTPFQSPMPVGITPNPTPPCDGDKPTRTDSSMEQEKTESRRRHKSVAAVLDSSDGLNRSDRQKTDEFSAFLEAGLVKDNLMARLVRSTENLTSPSARSVYFATPDHFVSSELSLTNGNFPELPTEYPCYRLRWSKRFSDPVMGLTCDDVMGDGMLDLVVLTLKGLHIMQPDLNEVSALVLERLSLIAGSTLETQEENNEGEEEIKHRGTVTEAEQRIVTEETIKHIVKDNDVG